MLNMKTIPQVNDNKIVTKEWLDELSLNIALQIKNSSIGKRKDIKCWEYYNEYENSSDLDYLRKFGKPGEEYVLPAKPKYIGIQRPKINHCVSIQARRPFVFSLFLADEISKQEKYDKKITEYYKAVEAKIKERKYLIEDELQNLNMQRQNIQNKVQMMQEAMQSTQDPQQQMNIKMQLQDLQVILPRIESQMTRIENEFLEEQLFNDQELEDLEIKLKYSWKDIREELGQKVLLGLRRILGIERKSNVCFTDKLVTGKEFYLVDYIPGEKLPRFEAMNDIKVYYPDDPNIEYTHQGRWVATEEEYTYEQVIKEWGGKLTKEQRTKLEEFSKSFNYTRNDSNFVSTTGNTAIDNPYSGTAMTTTGKGINVKKIWFRVERPAYMKYIPNKYTGDFYRKTITNEDLRREPIQEKKGEKLETRYIDDIYKAVIIDYDIPVDLGLKPYQYRHPDNPSFVPLPIIGKTFNSLTERPYSLIWATRHLQDLYNLLTYQEELLVALSGIKGQIIDLSQKPRTMSKEEHRYHRKLGSLYIETVGPDGRPKNISYNQWKDYDDTLSASVSTLGQMKQQIDLTCYYVMGMTPQTMGVVAPTDLVGTSEMARDQASLTTAILFHEHDEIERLAIEQLINITVQQCLDDETIMTILDNKLGSEDVKIPKGLFKNVAFEVGLINALQDEQNMKDLKMLSIKQNDKGLLPFDQLVTIFNTESVKELEKKLQYFSVKAEKIASMNAQSNQQAMMAAEKEKIQFAKEYEMQMAQSKNEIDGMKLKLQEAALQLQKSKMDQDAQIEAAKLQSERQLKMLDIGAEREVETAYLQEQNRAAVVSEQLQSLKLQLDAIAQKVNATLQNKESDLYHDIEIKKASIKKKERNYV